MSVFNPKDNHLVNQAGLHQFDSRNQEVSSFGGLIETKPFDGLESMEQTGAQDLMPSDNIGGLPEVLNRFYDQGMKSLDTRLTSQILYSIKSKIASSMHQFNETTPEQNISEMTVIKQEIPDNIDFHDNFDRVFQYPQTSQAVYKNPIENFSISSLESCSSNLSPDSSLQPSYTSSTSTSPKENIQFRLPETDIDQLEQNVSCDSTQTPSTGIVKCKQVSKQTNLLPPCRVCGDKASGFHYGANTCEACKGFFRRSLKKDKLDFKCIGSNNCEIQKGRRNNCPMCRYNRCLNAGMSKQAIKTGRYTHEKRTQDIVEVKTLNGELGPHLLQPSFLKIENRPKNTSKKTLSAENRQLLDCIYSAHKQIFPLWHKVLESGSHQLMSKRHAEQYQLKKNIKSEKISVVSEEQTDFDRTLKAEQEERKNTIDTVTKHIEISVMAFVKYAKSVPGFTDLTLNDQAALVKLSRFEIWMIGAHKFMDYDLKVISGPRGNSYHMEELAEIMDRDFVISLFNFAQSMQDIKLTNEETALLKCVALTFADRSELQEQTKVEDIQQRLAECLEELLGDGLRFAKVMNALIRLRNLTEWSKAISENMVLEWPNMKQHPLLLEIMSV